MLHRYLRVRPPQRWTAHEGEQFASWLAEDVHVNFRARGIATEGAASIWGKGEEPWHASRLPGQPGCLAR